jgi:arylsulfatase
LIAVAVSANAQDRPNVVIMLSDNVGYDDIGAYGAGEIRGMPTPRIDQLASEGLRLNTVLCGAGLHAIPSGAHDRPLFAAFGS